MSKRHRRPRQQQVTRRYIERTVQRARDEIIHAVLFATATAEPRAEPVPLDFGTQERVS